jgi:uncharacterized protein YoxC
VSVGEIAGLIAALALLVAVGLLAVPLLKLGRMIDEGTRRVEQSATIIDEAVNRLRDTGDTIASVNANLVHVEKAAAHVETISANVSALSSVVSSTFSGPLVKVAAFSYGVRRAARQRRRTEVTKRVKSELRQARR